MGKYLGGLKGIDNLDLAVGQGEIRGLIGPNGAGKTTILRGISGLKRLTSGEVWFQGKRIDGISPHAIVKVGIAHVPEGRRLFGLMIVRDNLAMGAFLQKDKGQIERDVEAVYQHFPILKGRQKQLAPISKFLKEVS